MFEDIIKTFETKNITVIPVETGEEACDQILKIIPKKSSIGYGGSETLKSIGIIDKIRTGDYQLYDKSKVESYTDEYHELIRKAQHADYFLSSSNAITEDGKIVNKDRTGNRVASLIYGPRHVVIVVGKNKIVEDFDAAIERIDNIAAQLNAKRLGVKPEELGCSMAVIERQADPSRITIILVNQNLGY